MINIIYSNKESQKIQQKSTNPSSFNIFRNIQYDMTILKINHSPKIVNRIWKTSLSSYVRSSTFTLKLTEREVLLFYFRFSMEKEKSTYP